ncbi:hypothetical protein SAMN02910292_00418 [Lachnospiraceae bacterium XBB2008]|nr:hypothetical protein SAMN02910292_00418 [Lachnospiraceae bacterium XBB2008]
MSDNQNSNIVSFGGGAYMTAPEETVQEQQPVQQQAAGAQQPLPYQQPVQPQTAESQQPLPYQQPVQQQTSEAQQPLPYQQPVPPQPPYQAPVAAPAYESMPYDSSLGEYLESERDTADTTGNLGLIFSIAGFCTGIFGLGLLLDLAGITLGAISAKKNPVKKGKGISAIAIGSLGFLLTLAIYGFAYYSYQNNRFDYDSSRDYTNTYDTDDVIDVDYDEVTDDTAEQSAPRERIHYSMGDTVPVHTVYGDYEVTFTGVRETDERSEYADTDPDRVVLIDYEYKNVSYTMDLDTYYNDELYINSSDFNFYDANGRAMDDYYVSVNSPHAVTPGHSTSGTMSLGLDNATDYIEVEISDYGYDGPGITVDLEW